MKQQLFLDNAIEKINHKEKNTVTKTSNYKTTHYLVSKENKKEYKKEVGDYFVISFKYETMFTKTSILTKEVEKIIKSFLKKYQNNDKVLIIGLGNKDVDADALGYFVTNKLIATNHYEDFLTIPKIALFNPSVTEKTGISSYKLIEMVVKDLNPDCIIMIDSLKTNNKDYLNQAIEINDTGIIPGIILNSPKEINKKTFNIPVLSIGVPTCLEIEKNLYTSTTIHEVLSLSSTIISNALNNIFIKIK